MNQPINRCDQAEDLIAFLYGELDERETRRFEQHRRNCSICESEVRDFGSIRNSIVGWRDQSLGIHTYDSITETRSVASQRSSTGSAWAAVRSFVQLSPLWMKAATGFALLLLFVLSGLGLSGIFHRSSVTSAGAEARYTQKDLDNAVNREVESRLAKLSVEQKQNTVRTVANAVSSSKPKLSGPPNQRSTTASLITPQRQRKPLTRAERDQLAADLRLRTNRDEDLQLLSDRINRDE
ncbi:MAG TPA: zf-HC2 domain-containing protein [Pyrinomonadaceae bacterium]